MPKAEETAFTGYTLGEGVRDGLPIGLGYLSVSFTFGILAVSKGLSWIQAGLISLLNVTSAGQVAGLNIMVTAGGLIAMIISQIVINLRYSLMGIALSQKADKTMTPLLRILLSFAITDEIFGITIARPGVPTPYYTFGALIAAVPMWALGTALGISPEAVRAHRQHLRTVLRPRAAARQLAHRRQAARAAGVVLNTKAESFF